VDPGGWRGFLKPNTPNYKRLELEKLTYKLCEEVRKGRSPHDAYYQWQQEWQWVLDHAAQEGISTAVGTIGTALKSLLPLLPKLK
jgi:hypothetical protein